MLNIWIYETLRSEHPHFDEIFTTGSNGNWQKDTAKNDNFNKMTTIPFQCI